MPKKFDGFRRDVPFPAENLGTIWRMRRSVSPSSSSAKPSQTRSRTFRVLARQLKSVVCRFRGFSTFICPRSAVRRVALLSTIRMMTLITRFDKHFSPSSKSG
jgi:hypothetical protein